MLLFIMLQGLQNAIFNCLLSFILQNVVCENTLSKKIKQHLVHINVCICVCLHISVCIYSKFKQVLCSIRAEVLQGPLGKTQ